MSLPILEAADASRNIPGARPVDFIDASLEEALAEESLMEPSLNPVVGDELLTWGVEIQLLFAFEETLLHKIIEKYLNKTLSIEYEIVKDIPKADRRWDSAKAPHNQLTKIPNEELPNHAYNSWGLRRKADPEKNIVGYSNQPRLMLRDKIRRHSDRVTIQSISELTEEQKTNDRLEKQWHVSEKSAIPGVGSKNLRKWLPEEKLDPNDDIEDTGNWDSFGLELISPFFDSDDSERGGGKATLSSLLAAVNTDEADNHAFITNQCGLHVRVESPGGFSLEELRILAVLLLMYEEELSMLHPPVRRPGHRVSRNKTETNRYGSKLEQNLEWRDEFQESSYTAAKQRLQREDFSTANYKESFPRFDQTMGWANAKNSVRDLVQSFNWPPAGPNGANKYGNPRRQVNFTPLVIEGDECPKTIVFQGARSTLDDQEVFRFVDLCLGLVRLAKYYAIHPAEFPAADLESHLNHLGDWIHTRVNVFDLLRLMGTDVAGISYWEGKKSRFQAVKTMSKAQRRDHEDDRSDLETTDDESCKDTDTYEPPPCPKKPDHRRRRRGHEDDSNKTPSKKGKYSRVVSMTPPNSGHLARGIVGEPGARKSRNIAHNRVVARRLFSNNLGGPVTIPTHGNPFGGAPMSHITVIRPIPGSSQVVTGVASLRPPPGGKVPAAQGATGAVGSTSSRNTTQGINTTPTRRKRGTASTPEVTSDDTDESDDSPTSRPSRKASIASGTNEKAANSEEGALPAQEPNMTTRSRPPNATAAVRATQRFASNNQTGLPVTPARKPRVTKEPKSVRFEDDSS